MAMSGQGADQPAGAGGGGGAGGEPAAVPTSSDQPGVDWQADGPWGTLVAYRVGGELRHALNGEEVSEDQVNLILGTRG
jgi:hypothetical protein